MSQSLWELSQNLSLPLKRSKNLCPKCHHQAVSIEENYAKCWCCGWKCDRVGFLEAFAGMSRSEAISYSGVGKELQERDALYQQVLIWCQQDPEPAAKYLASRGIDPGVYPHGYCPAGLLESKLKPETLKRWGLCSQSGVNLLKNRAIFPVYSLQGELVHFQARSLDPESELRWVSTTGFRPINEYLFNGHRWVGLQPEVLFICEGISDTLSLASLKLSAVGTFGIYPPFSRWLDCLAGAKHIVLAYDSDRHPLGHPKAKQYISWPSVLERWSWVYGELKAPAYTLQLPPEYKDINEWLVKSHASMRILQQYLAEAPAVEEFVTVCGSPEAQVRILSKGKRPELWEKWQKDHQQDWAEILQELVWRE